MKILDKVKIIQNTSNHPFRQGDIVTIFRIFPNNKFDVCNDKGDCWAVNGDEIFKIDNIMIQMTGAVLSTAKRLLKSQNKITTLEIKAEVIKDYPQFFWTQNYVSATMDDAYRVGMFTYQDTQTGDKLHRVYSDPTITIKPSKVKKATKMKTATAVAPKTKVASKPVATVKTTKTSVTPTNRTIGRSKALELMENNKGHFFTATFVDKKNQERTINCQYLKDQTYSRLGYVKVKEAIKAKMDANDAIRQINLQTLKSLKIAGNSYKVK